MQPYGELKKLGPGIWIRDGEWYDTSFRRRLTVMALDDGGLVIHNPFILQDADLDGLRALGKIAAIVMPNSMHGTELGWMAERVPEAKVFVPQAVAKKVGKSIRVDGSLEKDWPAAWAPSIARLPLEGMRLLHETVFFHRASRSLVVTDLVFNFVAEDFKSPMERRIMSWNRVGKGFGPSWLCDHVFTRDKTARRQSVETMLAWDFDRVIMNHGRCVETGGKALMSAAFG